MSTSGFLEKLLDGAVVEWKPLGDVTQPTHNIKWSEVDGTYQYIDLTSVDLKKRVVTETKEITADNAPNRAQRIVESGDLIFATTRPTQQRYCLISSELSGEVASTGYCVLRARRSEVLPKWLSHWISTNDFKSYVEEHQSGATYPAISDGKVKAFKIPIPCPEDPKKSLTIQAEIVRILDRFTELTAELTAELNARRKQYKHYREKLLTLDDGNVERKPLGEVAEYSKTRISSDQLNKSNHVGVDNLLQDRGGKVESNHVPTSGNLTEYQKGDILIGNIRPYLKKIWPADRTGGTNGDVLVIHPTDDTVDPRYIYQVLADGKFFNYSMKHAKGAKMPRGSKPQILLYPIPIPFADSPQESLAEQARIVAILDAFDVLTTSLTEGLPREIDLRQKQYAYYRDLLLNFPRPDADAA